MGQRPRPPGRRGVAAVNAQEPIDILLVEDNPGDVRLTREALKDTSNPSRVHVVMDGEEAMAFLRRDGDHRDAPVPDLILLDLNLPRKDGREVLEEIKDDDALRKIPVVVLTTSEAEQDILKVYELHANCFITKPVDLDRFMQVVKTIEEFWFGVVKLPPR